MLVIAVARALGIQPERQAIEGRQVVPGDPGFMTFFAVGGVP